MRFVRGGVRRHAPQRNFFKWCNSTRFDVYLDQILFLNFFFKLPFCIQKFVYIKNKYFRCMLAMG